MPNPNLLRRKRAFDKYAECQNISEVSRALSIPRETLQRWKKDEDWDSRIATKTSSDPLQSMDFDEADLELARKDSSFFTEYIYGYKNVEMHHSWHKFLAESDNGLILAPRDHGKTENISIGRVLWEIGKNVNIRVKIATESDRLSSQVLYKISETIRKNDKFKAVFPNVRPNKEGPWTRKLLTIERTAQHKDATVEGAGILTASTGGRADLIIFDDIAGMRNTLYYPRLREHTKEAFYSNWMNMLDGPKAKWFCVGTPWHVKDIIWELKENDSVAKAPAYVVDKDFNSPWPEHCPPDFLKKKLLLYKQKHYNRAYRLIPVSDEESWIKVASLEDCIDRTLKPRDVIDNPNIIKFVGVDLGHRKGVDATPSVVFTVGRMPNGKRVPCDIRISKQSGIMEVARIIIKVWEEYHPSLVFVENVAFQQSLIDVVQTLGPKGIPIEGYFTGTQKMSPDVGVPSLLSEIEAKSWIIPLGDGGKHDETCKCSYCYWMGEIKEFPQGSYDTLMASWFALEALRKVMERSSKTGGFSVWSYGD